MGNFCGTPKADEAKPLGPSITDTDKAILSLKAQRKKLQDQQKLLELRIDRHSEVARELVREKQNDKALLVLKKKKLVEKQLTQLSTLQFTTESLISDVEMTKQTNKVFGVLKQGNDVMKVLQQEVTVDDVRKLMEDTADAKAYQDEIAAALGQSLTSEDTDAIDEEFKQMEAETLDQERLDMPNAPLVPEGQKTKVQTSAAAQKTEAAEEEAQEAEPPKVALLAT